MNKFKKKMMYDDVMIYDGIVTKDCVVCTERT